MRGVIPFLLVLGACSNKLHGGDVDDPRHPPDDTDPVDTGVPDSDGDGDPDDSDCAPDDPSIHHGAAELCNGIDDDCDGVLGDGETDEDGNGDLECEELCDPVPGDSTIATLSDCEYTPSPSGTAFSARVEWAMTQGMDDPSDGHHIPAYTFADDADYTSVFQAPAVGQLTDDDGDGDVTSFDRPDIAVVMADPVESTDGVLRVIAGDGSAVWASAHWQSLTNRAGTFDYAPYHYAGVAIGNVDTDDAVEIATLVVRQSDGACFPATYEVHQSGHNVDLVLEGVYPGAAYSCMAHAPAIADLDGDGRIELIYGRAVFEGDDWSQKWYGAGGRGWYGRADYAAGYWNSGYHSFAYDVDGDGAKLEVVAGRTIYTSTGGTYCELGSYSGTTWVPAIDGYPAIADIARFQGDTLGEPEVVVTGNETVAVYHGVPDYDPNGLARCVLIDELPNDPLADPTVPNGLPTPAQCDATAISFGGPPTVADFDGDGLNEIGVAGSCWYSVFELANGALSRYALTNTRDWSSASTGSTVFDFNGDGAAEVVFSDEQAVYVWGVDTSGGLKPWQRLLPLLTETSHKSWTIHEYPLVADVDADGKAEIIAVNSHLPPDHEDSYGIYVLGAADDDWVSARQLWNQHAYYVTNIDDSGAIGVCDPNYAPYTADDYNSFRQQSPGEFGSYEASNVRAVMKDLCQEGCGDVIVRVQVANDSAHVTVDATVPVALYGLAGSSATLLDSQELGTDLPPGTLSAALEFTVHSNVWSRYDAFRAVADDPAVSGFDNGVTQECDETDNTFEIPIAGVCP
jgi:hypothetical protein